MKTEKEGKKGKRGKMSEKRRWGGERGGREGTREREMAGERSYEGEKQDAGQHTQTLTSFRACGRSLIQCKLDRREK